jgi:hypothetical protein
VSLVEPQIIEAVRAFVAEPMNRGYINCYPQGRALAAGTSAATSGGSAPS